MTRLIRPTLAVTLLATIVATNWAVQHIEPAHVGTWATVPAGAWFAGVAFSLRDTLHKTGGRTWVIGTIAAGTAVSSLVAGPGLLLASASAFLFSELADWGVYSWLDRTGRPYAAVVLSNTVGATLDTVIFLGMAQHLGHVPYLSLSWSMTSGQWLGKIASTVPALAILWAVRTYRRPRAQLAVAP